jgi:hypothetical protein
VVGAGGAGQGRGARASRAAGGKGRRGARTSVEKAAPDLKPPPDMAGTEVESPGSKVVRVAADLPKRCGGGSEKTRRC